MFFIRTDKIVQINLIFVTSKFLVLFQNVILQNLLDSPVTVYIGNFHFLLAVCTQCLQLSRHGPNQSWAGEPAHHLGVKGKMFKYRLRFCTLICIHPKASQALLRGVARRCDCPAATSCSLLAGRGWEFAEGFYQQCASAPILARWLSPTSGKSRAKA